MSTSKDANKSLEEKRDRLISEIKCLESELGEAEAQSIVNKHIKLLHSYNESKDAAQALIGKLAVATGTTVRELHQKYGLSSED
ncbi:hypothetical protein FRB91_002213 [Serendipita sp. 411]|nr:hypothetical protein FRB91_002213 [Serendipita sp. 411]